MLQIGTFSARSETTLADSFLKEISEGLISEPPAAAKGFTAYGNVKRALACREPEWILSGPADTGKTIGILNYLHRCAYKYPGASIVIARKRLTDTYPTVLETFRKKILKKDSHVNVYGGDKPEWFDYDNGSRLWVAGLDKSSKVLSSEHDIIYINQVEECSLVDWETVTTRTTGRAGNMPYSQSIGDCNPASPNHWIRRRAADGHLRFFEAVHQDNPELFDQTTMEVTEEGISRLSRLKNLSGERLLRLYHGLWAAPEGAIYDIFDGVDAEGNYGKHVVKHFDPPLTWPRIVGIDPFGAEIAAVWLAFDIASGILNVYREYMEPFGMTTRGHADNIKALSKGETIFAWICGAKAERAWRTEWTAAGIPVVEPPQSDVWLGIDRVYQLLRSFRLVIHDNCYGLISELGDYRRQLDRDGLPTENIENKHGFHFLDSTRYAIVWVTEPRAQIELIYAPLRIGPSW